MLALLAFFFGSQAFAYDSRFAVDPQVNLQQLQATGRIDVRVTAGGGDYAADASAVFRSPVAPIYDASRDYDHFVQMGMPNVLESHIVEKASPTLLYMWSHISTMGQTNKAYMEVRLHPALSAPTRGIEWELAPKRPRWPYQEYPAFSRLEGSIYFQPLANGYTYVRYYLSGNPDTSLPEFIVDSIARKQFHDGVYNIMVVLAREAATRDKH